MAVAVDRAAASKNGDRDAALDVVVMVGVRLECSAVEVEVARSFVLCDAHRRENAAVEVYRARGAAGKARERVFA